MSMQAQIRQWVDEAMHTVLDPLFERLDKAVERLDAVEHYIQAFEQTDGIPAFPAPREKVSAEKAVADAARKAPVTGRPSGRPAATARAQSAEGKGRATS